MERENKIKNRVKEHLEYLIENGYEVVFISLQGSQNYELDIYGNEYMSDIDTKAVILPSFEDFLFNRQPVSKTIVLNNDEHIDVKDVRIVFENYKKQNINFIEMLFTKYKIVNEKYKDLVNLLFDFNEEIAHININQAIRCMVGMSKEKLNALKHPYPSIINKIERFGYDPKQLHHILRMNDFIKKYVSGKPYKDCLIPDNKEYLIEIKKGKLNLEEAEKLAILVDNNTTEIKNEYTNYDKKDDIINEKGIEILNKVKYDLLKLKFKEDLEDK